MAAILEISPNTLHDIVYSKLGFRKVSKTFLKSSLITSCRDSLAQGIIPLHDNAKHHTFFWQEMVSMLWLENSIQPHSPDPTPSHYHLFDPCKYHLAGQKVDTDESLINRMNDWVAKFDGTFFKFKECIYSLVHCWQNASTIKATSLKNGQLL